MILSSTAFVLSAQIEDLLYGEEYTAIIGIGIAVLTILVFFIREERIKKKYKRLKQELDARMQEIINQEKQISIQKEKLQHQIELSEEQNQQIHEQAIELDRHRHSLEKKGDLRADELLHAKEKAEESDKLKTAFLENISHEVRTPMNAIIGFASLLDYPDIDEDSMQKYVRLIHKNSMMLLNFMDSVLDASKVKAGQLNIIKTPFPVNQFLQRLLAEVKEGNEALMLKKLSLELMLPEPVNELVLYSDANRVGQVLRNILSNAIKYTDKGGIKFGYYLLFDSDYNKEPSALQFYVEDTGIGISEERSDYIFNWFNKIEDHKDQVFRGAGMGLFLGKEIVSLLGGKMWFNSKVGEGSTFYFTLPFLNTDIEGPQEEVDESRVEDSPQLATEYSWDDKTILIAEDEINNVIYLKEIIRRTGATILEADNGTKAVQSVREHPEISLVLMDIMMPELDGYGATRAVKKIRPELPVIAQTAYNKAGEKEKSLEAGCDAYITKPYDPPALLKMIGNFF